MAGVRIAEAEVRLREPCPACGGTGRGDSKREYCGLCRTSLGAWNPPSERGAEMPCGHSWDLLMWTDECEHCSGEGKVERWVPLAELARLLAQTAGWWRGGEEPAAKPEPEAEGPPEQAMLFRNGLWAVFNAAGQQLAEYQGPDSYAVRNRLRSVYQGPVEVQGLGMVRYPDWVLDVPIQGRFVCEEPVRR